MSVLEATARIPRRRDRALVAALLKHCAANDGLLTEEVAAAAIGDAWEKSRHLKPKTAMEVVTHKLKTNKNIREALGLIYEEFGDFTVEDAVKMHVAHIYGDAPKRASYPALKDFVAMVLPLPAKKVEVGMTVAQVGATMLTNVPAIEARALGPATVSAIEDTQTVEFTEAEPDDE